MMYVVRLNCGKEIHFQDGLGYINAASERAFTFANVYGEVEGIYEYNPSNGKLNKIG